MKSNNSFDIDKIPDASIMAKMADAANAAQIHPIARKELEMLIPEITKRARFGYRFYDYGTEIDRPKLHPHTLRELRYKGYKIIENVDQKYDRVTDTTNWRCVHIEW